MGPIRRCRMDVISECHGLVSRQIGNEFLSGFYPISGRGVLVRIYPRNPEAGLSSGDIRTHGLHPTRSSRGHCQSVEAYAVGSGLQNRNESFSIMGKGGRIVIERLRPSVIERRDVMPSGYRMVSAASASTLGQRHPNDRRLRRARRKGRNRSREGIYRRAQIRHRRRNRVRPGIEIEHVGNDGVPSGGSERVARLNVGHRSVPRREADGDRSQGSGETRCEKGSVLNRTENGREF